jgi:hypothetical protein
VQAVDRPAIGQELGWSSRKARTHSVVAARAIFFDTAECLLVTSVHARHTWQRKQRDQRMLQVPLVSDLARDARDIVIAHECQRQKLIDELLMAL